MLSGMFTSGCTAVLMAISYPIYLHKLGYQTYGIWIALAVVISMSQLGNLGMSQALVKRVAEHFERREHEEIARYYSTAVFTLMILAGCLFGTLFVLKRPILQLLGLNAKQVAEYSALATGVFALSVMTFVVDVVAAVLSGIGRIDLYNYSQLATQAVSILCALSLLLLNFKLGGMLVAQIAGYSTGLIFAVVCITKRVSKWPLRPAYYSPRHLKRLLGQGMFLASGWALSLLFHPVNKILLAQSGQFALLPVYEIAVNLSMRLRNLFEAGQRALMPETSRLIGTREFSPTSIVSLLKSSLRGLLVYAAPLYVIVFLAATPLTRVWLGSSFNPLVPGAIRIFLIGTFVSLIGTPFYYALIGAGRAQAVLIANGLQLGVNVLLVVALLRQSSAPLFLTLGVADLSLAVSSVTLALLMRRAIRSLRRHETLSVSVAAA